MLQCECTVALCVQCARQQVWDTLVKNHGDYHEASVACPKCKAMPVCYTLQWQQNTRLGYNVNAESVKEVERQVLLLCVPPSSRTLVDRATQYGNEVNRYRSKYGLLTDIRDPTACDSPHFYRLLLARAEKYCRDNALVESEHPATVLLDALPLGPLEALTFIEHNALDTFLHGQPVDNTCGLCGNPIAPGEAALSLCACRQVSAADTLDPWVHGPLSVSLTARFPLRNAAGRVQFSR